MLALGSRLPVPGIRMRGGAGDYHRFAVREAVVEDVGVVVLGLPDDVDGDVFAEGFGVAGLEEGSVAEFRCGEADGLGGTGYAARIGLIGGSGEEVTVS